MLFKGGRSGEVIVLTEWGVTHLRRKDRQNQNSRERFFFPDFFFHISKIKKVLYFIPFKIVTFTDKEEKKVVALFFFFFFFFFKFV